MTVKRRFYKDVTVTDDLGIALDGRVVKTPLKHPLRLPNRPLAEAVAAEWAGQEEKIEPLLMILTRLANTAIDVAVPERERVAEEVLAYANSDMVCYRAEAPDDLAFRQCGHWDPVLAWARNALGAEFHTRPGIVHQSQPQAALDAAAAAIARLTAFQLSAVHTVTTGTGSALLALMLAHGAISQEDAWTAAHVDEDYQTEHWGMDMEARVRRLLFREDYDKACEFLSLAGLS